MYSNTEKRKIDMFCSVLDTFEKSFAVLTAQPPSFVEGLKSSRLRALLTLGAMCLFF